MLQQECGWFDEAEHSSAALSARLTADVGNLQGVRTTGNILMEFGFESEL